MKLVTPYNRNARLAYTSNAVSMCLFKGSRWNPVKHLDPLILFLAAWRDGKLRETHDILLFLEEGFPNIPVLEQFAQREKGFRAFVCKPAPEWSRHLYRYLPLNMDLGYRWISCSGTDTPHPHWLRSVTVVADLTNCPLATLLQCHHHATHLMSGSLSIRRDLQDKLGDYLEKWLRMAREEPSPDNPEFLRPNYEEFTFDEILLSEWARIHPVPTAYWCQGPFIHEPLQTWVKERLIHGPKIVLIGNGEPERTVLKSYTPKPCHE